MSERGEWVAPEKLTGKCVCCDHPFPMLARAWEDQETVCAKCGVRCIFGGAKHDAGARQRIRENTARMLGIPALAAPSPFERQAIHPLDPRASK